jgi:hypothetical protein
LGKLEGKRPLRRHGRKWENNKMNHQKVEYGGIDWINLAQDDRLWKLVNAVMNLILD